MEWALELIGVCALTLVGWLHARQSKMEQALENKVDKDDFQEMKEELDKAVTILTDLRVENARWQGIVERVVETNSKNS